MTHAGLDGGGGARTSFTCSFVHCAIESVPVDPRLIIAVELECDIVCHAWERIFMFQRVKGYHKPGRYRYTLAIVYTWSCS